MPGSFCWTDDELEADVDIGAVLNSMDADAMDSRERIRSKGYVTAVRVTLNKKPMYIQLKS
jgi:hypothetical protein